MFPASCKAIGDNGNGTGASPTVFKAERKGSVRPSQSQNILIVVTVGRIGKLMSKNARRGAVQICHFNYNYNSMVTKRWRK